MIYILVKVFGGLIDSAELFTSKQKACAAASAAWKTCDYESDDIKVIGSNDGEVYWQPAKR